MEQMNQRIRASGLVKYDVHRTSGEMFGKIWARYHARILQMRMNAWNKYSNGMNENLGQWLYGSYIH